MASGKLLTRSDVLDLLPQTNEDKLAVLTELLEAGEPIPEELAQCSARLIREALADSGKLDFAKRRGRKSAEAIKRERAFQVALLIVADGVPRSEAIEKVAKKFGRKPSTVEKDYKHFGRHYRDLARFITEGLEFRRLFAELKQLLLTFRHDDGSRFSIEEVEQIAGALPASMIKVYVQRIRSGPLRRDFAFLKSVVSRSA